MQQLRLNRRSISIVIQHEFERGACSLCLSIGRSGVLMRRRVGFRLIFVCASRRHDDYDKLVFLFLAVLRQLLMFFESG